MLKTGKLITAIAVATLALPAVAGSWPPILPARKAQAGTTQPAPTKPSAANFTQSQDGYAREGEDGTWRREQDRYFRSEDGPQERTFAPRKLAASQPAVNVATAKANGFEYTGGEAGWQLSQHKYVLKAGRFAHSDECDHVIRTAKAATPAELESARLLYPPG